jgi:polyisoprenyl-phosphate glycosyltransferase
MDISVIIPVFKGEKTLEKLFEGISQNLRSSGSFELLFIYDRGPDNSWKTLKILRNKDPETIRIFRLKKNYGQHNAILFGISESKGDLIITMDEDLQHDPKYLVSLIEKQKEADFDLVYGRFPDLKHSSFRKVASKILQKLLKVLIPGLGYYSSFRVLKKEAAKEIIHLRNSYSFIDASLLKLNLKTGYLDINHQDTARKSTYTILKLASHAFHILFAYTKITIWALIISLVFIITGGVLAKFDLINTGLLIWLLISGIVLFFFGLIGEIIHKREFRNNLLPVVCIETD